MTDAIDAYLRSLRDGLGGRRVDADRLVTEVESHLRDAQDELVASGRDPLTAAENAVARFGDPRGLGAAFPRSAPPLRLAIERWIAIALTVVGAGAVVEAVALDSGTGDSLWVRLVLGFLGLALVEWTLLRSGAAGIRDWSRRATVVGLAVTGLGCTAVGALVVDGQAWVATAVAGAAVAAALGTVHHFSSRRAAAPPG